MIFEVRSVRKVLESLEKVPENLETSWDVKKGINKRSISNYFAKIKSLDINSIVRCLRSN